ncbi:hypothetical protein ACHAXS_007041, partial [Conticribra weissflogii]
LSLDQHHNDHRSTPPSHQHPSKSSSSSSSSALNSPRFHGKNDNNNSSRKTRKGAFSKMRDYETQRELRQRQHSPGGKKYFNPDEMMVEEEGDVATTTTASTTEPRRMNLHRHGRDIHNTIHGDNDDDNASRTSHSSNNSSHFFMEETTMGRKWNRSASISPGSPTTAVQGDDRRPSSSVLDRAKRTVSDAHKTIEYLSRYHDGNSPNTSTNITISNNVQEEGSESSATAAPGTPTGNDKEHSQSWSQGIVSRRLRILEQRSPRNGAKDDVDAAATEGVYLMKEDEVVLRDGDGDGGAKVSEDEEGGTRRRAVVVTESTRGDDLDQSIGVVVEEEADFRTVGRRSQRAEEIESANEGTAGKLQLEQDAEGDQEHKAESVSMREIENTGTATFRNFHTHNQQKEKEHSIDNERVVMDNLVCEEENIGNEAFHEVLASRDDDAIQTARPQQVGQDSRGQHAPTVSAPRAFFDDDRYYDGIEQNFSNSTGNESSTVNWDALAYSMSEDKSADEFGGSEVAESLVAQAAKNHKHSASSMAKASFFGEPQDSAHEYSSFAQTPNFFGNINDSSTRTINQVPSDEEGGFTPRLSNASSLTLKPTLSSNSTAQSSNDKSEYWPEISHKSFYASSPPSHLSDNNKIEIEEELPRLTSRRVPQGYSNSTRIDLIKKRHDEEIEKIRMTRAANSENHSSGSVGRARSEEENVAMSPNSMNEINDLKERIIAMKRQHENAIQKVHSEISDSDMMSPRRQQVAEMEIQSRIELMTTQHKKNMESMRRALENLKQDRGGVGKTANFSITPKSKVKRHMPNLQTDTSGDPNERHIAECVGLWKINAQRFEKAKETIGSCKNEQSGRNSADHFSFDREEIITTRKCDQSQNGDEDYNNNVVATPVKLSNEQLMKINAELEEEIKKIQLLSPKSAKKRMDTVFGREGLEALASPSTIKNSTPRGSRPPQKISIHEQGMFVP